MESKFGGSKMNNKLPEGWKEVELGDVLEYEQPTDYIVNSEDYSDEYKTPVLTAGKSFILGYTDEKKGIYNKLPVIIFDDFTVASKYVTFPFKVKSSAMKLLTPKNKDVNLKYIFWLMQTIKVNSVSHKRYYLSKYQHIKILFPPFPTQQKIVSILEKAEKAKELRKESDELTNEFLKAVFMELFGDPLAGDSKFPIIKMGDYIQLIMGQAPLSNSYNAEGHGTIFVKVGEFGELYPRVEVYTTSPLKLAKKGDVLICVVGATIGKINKGIDCAIGRSVAAIRPKKGLTQDYLFFLLAKHTQKYREKSQGSAQGVITKDHLNDLKIPLPPIELQNKFASIVKEVEAMKEQQKHSKEQLDDLFNVLMQKAFKGDLQNE